MKVLLSPSDLAEALGTSESSVRRWCDGGKLGVTRTSGGHRKIGLQDAIRFIRKSNLPVVRPELLMLCTAPSDHAASERSPADRLYDALVAGDVEMSISLVESMYIDGQSLAEICDGPLRQSMSRVGSESQTQERAIFLEHRATSICLRILNQLRSRIPQPAAGASVALGGGPSSDPFILPSTVVAIVLADLGFKDVNLGPDTPWQVIDASAKDSNAEIVWLSLTAPRPKKVVESELNQLAAQLARRGTQLVLGGQAVKKYRFDTVPTLHVFDSLMELSGFARGVLAGGRKSFKSRRP